MSSVVKMPKLGLSMVEGLVSEWLVSEGDHVSEGDLLVTVETSKINYQVESGADGIVRKMFAKAGETLPVGGSLCVIGAADEEIDFAALSAAVVVPDAALPGGFDARTTTLGAAGAFGSGSPTSTVSAVASPATVPYDASEASASDGAARTGLKASPVARRLAATYGIDLAALTGSGPGGRIEKKDVEAAHAARGTGAASAGSQGPGASTFAGAVAVSNGTAPRLDLSASRREPARRPLTGMRRVIAENMAYSMSTAAHATMVLRADMSELIDLRREINEDADSEDRVTFTDLFVKAIGRLLVDNPMMRTVIDGDNLVTLEDIDISIAVHIGEAGLVVPVIRDCDRRSLRDISRERRRLMEAGRSGTLALDDISGGCYTLTNMGAVYDLDQGTPIINPPQSAILGVSSIKDDVVAVDGAPAVRPMMTLFQSIDHRVIDGEPSVRFLNQVRDLLANPRRGFALN